MRKKLFPRKAIVIFCDNLNFAPLGSFCQCFFPIMRRSADAGFKVDVVQARSRVATTLRSTSSHLPVATAPPESSISSHRFPAPPPLPSFQQSMPALKNSISDDDGHSSAASVCSQIFETDDMILNASLFGRPSKNVPHGANAQLLCGRSWCGLKCMKFDRGALCLLCIVLILASGCVYVGITYGEGSQKPRSDKTVYLGACTDIPSKCGIQECHAINSTAYSCSCPSWLWHNPPWLGTGDGGCMCPDYFTVPDYERRTCVTRLAPHVSLWQVVGLIAGVAFCAAVWFVSVWRLRQATSWFFGWLVFYTFLFGLVFGIGSSHIFPAPKVFCGYLYSNDSSYVNVCDQNAACTLQYYGPSSYYRICRCNAGYSGDGKSCT